MRVFFSKMRDGRTDLQTDRLTKPLMELHFATINVNDKIQTFHPKAREKLPEKSSAVWIQDKGFGTIWQLRTTMVALRSIYIVSCWHFF